MLFYFIDNMKTNTNVTDSTPVIRHRKRAKIITVNHRGRKNHYFFSVGILVQMIQILLRYYICVIFSLWL